MDKLAEFFTSQKFLKTCSFTFLSVITLLLGVYIGTLIPNTKDTTQVDQPEVIEEKKPEGLMLLIEFEDTVGLNNFVYQMNERNIPGVLMVNAEYVENNCEFVKGLQDYNIEIAGVCPGEPFWDVPYQDQFEIMETTKERIEACTGSTVRIMGSRYFAYDENTLKAADALDIPYVFARGTTGPKATIYKPEEYDVKIFSVSNIDSPQWGTGSLCDYSYWAREGDPQDFKDELFSAFANYDKVSPVSHTYIGGSKARWNEVYLDMFDNIDVDWVNLDQFGQVDIYESYANIPDNREVQYTTPKPEIPLEDEIDVDNPCAVIDSPEEPTQNTEIEDSQLVIFHNGSGAMCLEALDFFEENDIEYTEYLNSEEDFRENLNIYKDAYNDVSEGVSTEFGYYPMIFYKGRAFSGFNDDIANTILSL